MTRLSCIAIICVVLACALAENELYSSQYDDIDVRGIFDNVKLRRQYYKCFMDLAPCRTADMKFFKETFPEAIHTQCRKCTEKQKENFDFIVDWYTTNKREEWNALVAKTLQDISKKKSDK